MSTEPQSIQPLEPKRTHRDKRMHAIMTAITQVTEAGETPPAKWLDELAELIAADKADRIYAGAVDDTVFIDFLLLPEDVLIPPEITGWDWHYLGRAVTLDDLEMDLQEFAKFAILIQTDGDEEDEWEEYETYNSLMRSHGQEEPNPKKLVVAYLRNP